MHSSATSLKKRTVSEVSVIELIYAHVDISIRVSGTHYIKLKSKNSSQNTDVDSYTYYIFNISSIA